MSQFNNKQSATISHNTVYIKYTNIKTPYLERNSLNLNIILLPHDSKVLSPLIHEFSKLTSNFCNSNLKSCVCAQKQNNRDCKTYALWLDLIGSACLCLFYQYDEPCSNTVKTSNTILKTMF